MIWTVGPDPLLTPGRAVWVTYNDRSQSATVKLASPHGRTLVLAFDSQTGYTGVMPVFWKDGAYFNLITRKPVGIVAELAKSAGSQHG